MHSHLRMTGSWATYEEGRRWRRSPRRAWLVLRARDHAVVQFDGPVLELLTESRTRFDRRLAMLGPDILAPELDEQRFLRRLREDDPTRPIGDALLDQRTIAGIGNLWKAEACWRRRDRPVARRPARSATTRRSRSSAPRARACRSPRRDGTQTREPSIYRRVGMPCPRCGTTIASRGQGDDNRMTYWCPGCQR